MSDRTEIEWKKNSVIYGDFVGINIVNSLGLSSENLRLTRDKSASLTWITDKNKLGRKRAVERWEENTDMLVKTLLMDYELVQRGLFLS